MNKTLTRRRFLNMVGAAGGSTAVYQTSMALGLMQETGPVANLDLERVRGGQRKVAILGAGIAGLTVAYELERAGYDVTIIEASKRIGGRNLTLRHGDEIDELGNTRICNFDDHPELFFNCGPARLPGHHRRAMHYCKTLGVELQIKANYSRNNYTHDTEHFDGRPVRISEYVADARGFLAELVHKAADRDVFDQPLTGEDKERLLMFARTFGDLDAGGAYRGSFRAGYESGGFVKAGEIKEPLDFGAILDSRYWQWSMHASQNPDWADPLMEPVGGMDNIVRGFVGNIESPIHVNAQVQAITLRDVGVDVIYNHKGKREKLVADYCFNSIPSHFMGAIPNNFPKDYMAGLLAMRHSRFFKIGLQMSERFWEREGIYGGITTTTQPINQIWYPSHGIHGEKGVVLGAYTFTDETARLFERMSPEERIRFAGECGDKIHAGYSDYIETGVSIPWARMNHMMGCGSDLAEVDGGRHFKRLQAPEGRHYMIGDQISFHSSWQEGAFASAEYALLDLDQRVRAESAATKKG